MGIKNSVKALLLFFLITGWLSAEEKEYWTIYFENARGEEVALKAEVADDNEEKKTGLMFRKSLPPDEGMIFVYNNPTYLNFWMQNTYIPLSIAFVHKKNFIISIHDMKPMDTSIISSDTPAVYAIEVNKGWFHKNKILNGSKVRMEKH